MASVAQPAKDEAVDMAIDKGVVEVVDEDLYSQMKNLQRQLEFYEIQVIRITGCVQAGFCYIFGLADNHIASMLVVTGLSLLDVSSVFNF